jgi:hypothetical protein
MPIVLTDDNSTRVQLEQETIILSDRHELAHAREFVLDVIADNMTLDEAQEITDSWSHVKIARFVSRQYGGIWSERGPTEYR